jgi:Ca2+/Na+ antiporter
MILYVNDNHMQYATYLVLLLCTQLFFLSFSLEEYVEEETEEESEEIEEESEETEEDDKK